jgi:ParB family chromosome partitioning protein
MSEEVKMVPIERIRILNPRYRDKKKFQVIVESIRAVGLKKPIQVNRISQQEGHEGYEFDLVCGQGRIEAFMALGHKEIPAVVVNVSKEDRLLRSLVENMARRFATPAALMVEIERLKGLGYTNMQIGEKLGMDHSMVGGFLALKNDGEERVLDAALGGRIPLTVAMEIVRANEAETQRELLKGYEAKQLSWNAIRTVKRLMDQRRYVGKERDKGTRIRKSRTSVEAMVNAYKRESQRQKLLVKKARVCDAKLLFVVTAFEKLLADENFVNLLRAEGLATMPKYLSAKLDKKQRGPNE